MFTIFSVFYSNFEIAGKYILLTPGRRTPRRNPLEESPHGTLSALEPATEYIFLVHLKYFYQHLTYFCQQTHLGGRSLGRNLAGGTSLEEGSHLLLLDVVSNLLRCLPILILCLYT